MSTFSIGRAVRVVVANVKGGAAKTTTAVQLALHLHLRGYRALLVDADGGRSALSWSLRAGEEWPDELVVVAHPDPTLVRKIPPMAEGYDVVVIDTPHDSTGEGKVAPVLAAAIALADVLLVPVEPALAVLDRMNDMVGAIEAEQNRRDVQVVAGIVRADTRSQGEIGDTRDELADAGLAVLDPVVPLLAGIRRAFGTAKVLGEYEDFTTAVIERAEAASKGAHA